MNAPQTPKEALDELRRDWKSASPDERPEIEHVADAVKLHVRPWPRRWSPMIRVSLDDTSNCGEPGRRCECCGTTGDITVVTAALGRLGVGCLSMCPRCANSTVPPPVAVATAFRVVAQHAGHLGIDLDEMAEYLAGGDRR